MKWDHLGVTNVLLLIITVLMLVLVAQQPRNQHPVMSKAPNLHEMGQAPQVGHSNVNPHANMQEAPSAETDEGFNFQNMIFAALACPDDATITLADFGCEGEEATKRREYVENIYKQGLPPRALFDEIIQTFGMEALTDEAREIRQNNRSQ
ncbi:MAG: hypothetical protein KDK51_01455 [Deltaproteobacteria bacterium]|nr:hypothetical protein [Deltaproteobacteria bacterium]